MIGREIYPILQRYPLDTLLGQCETFATPLGDPLINEWIRVEDIGASGVRSKAKFLFKAHG